MKKLILVSLCVLFAACGPVFGYWVKGKVVDESGTGVSGATVYIYCYSANDGNSYHDTRTSIAGGAYAGGWLLKDCTGGTMVVKAIKGGKSGSLSWVAGGPAARVDVGQNVTIKIPTFNTGELHCQPEPVTISSSYTMVPVSCIMFVQATHGPILVNGGNATLQYDPAVMYCASVEPCAPFYSLSYYESPPGTIHVNAYAPGGMFIPVLHGDYPTSLFTLNMVARDYGTPGVESFFDVFTEISVDTGGMISGFPVRVELVIGETNTKCPPYFRLDTKSDWQEALSSGHVYAMEEEDWEYYMLQWQNFTVQGTPYPNHTFREARQPTGDLYVYGGGGGGGGGALDPCDAGLVMYWGSPADGSYSSAWKYDYLKDPDLSNCTISVAVTAPTRVNVVSFGLENPPIPGGPIRAWYWNCGAAGSGAPIIWNTPTIITIDTSKTGTGAAKPTASAYANNPGFDIKNVQWLIVDEDANWVGGGTSAPAPGTGMIGMWNYWHWLTISPKTTLAKGYYTKWSQPPVVIDTNMPHTISGWDELSTYEPINIVADDWECNDSRPITDIHWWGSFIGWTQPYLPPIMPRAFQIGIWTDDPCNFPGDFSHPDKLVWENYCDSYVWNFAGYDKDPRQGIGGPPQEDSCFQFNQLLSQDEWFYQEQTDPCHPRVYWLSIAPMWGEIPPTYPWGWKSRPHFFNDDAVVIQAVNPLPLVIGSTWMGGYPIQWPAWPNPEGISWDMAFELSTNEPDTTYNAMDFNKDGIVNFFDFAIFAQEWLKTSP